MQKIRTNRFSATIGTVAGYQGDAALSKAATMTQMGEAWQNAAAQVMKDTGIYVSGVITASACLYATDWGCPVGGEPTFTIVGSRNPTFCPDTALWQDAVLAVVNLVKNQFEQSTVTVEFEEIEQVYLS